MTPVPGVRQSDLIIQDVRRAADQEPRHVGVGGPGPGGNTPTDPLDLTYSGEHTEAAMGDSGWDRSNQGTKDGFKLTVQTGESYYDAGDEKLYKYTRVLTFNREGQCVLTSAETRVVVDTPAEGCA